MGLLEWSGREGAANLASLRLRQTAFGPSRQRLAQVDMKTREQILEENPLISHLLRSGIKIRGTGRERTTTRCPTTQHKPDHWCVSIEADKQLFKCHDCGCGGSLIDWLMLERAQTAAEVLRSFDVPNEPVAPSRAQIAATYDYVNESNELVYQAVRMQPKSFRQRQPDANGGWIWSMDGITRILFNLPAVLQSPSIAIAEGEKDCLTLIALGYVATCNVGGAGKWLPAYTDRLKGKDVVIFPDNDNAGRKHAADIIASLDAVANSVKQVIIPDPYKDVTEFIEACADQEQAGRELAALVEKTAHIVKPLPIYTVAEMECQYREHAKRIQTECFDLSKFLPDFKRHVRPMVPGEVLLLMADTGVGKTVLLQQMLRAAAPLPSLLFEMELPSTLLFERFVQMQVGCFASDVQNEYRDNVKPLWSLYKSLLHITVCPESGLTVEQIESYIVRSELKIGRRPVIVAVDYVGLLNSTGTRSRYEAVSRSAEQLKVIAKRTGTILLIATQIHRPDKKESLEIGLHDAKDSGSLECSAGIILGVWRPEKTRLMLKILKNTSGTSGEIIEARFDGTKMQIAGIQ